MKDKLILLAVALMLALAGCQGACGNIEAKDATERGLSYVALAIITSAVIRAIFNK